MSCDITFFKYYNKYSVYIFVIQFDVLRGVAPKLMLVASLVLYAPQLLGFIYTTSFFFKRTGFALLFYFLVFAIVSLYIKVELFKYLINKFKYYTHSLFYSLGSSSSFGDAVHF